MCTDFRKNQRCPKPVYIKGEAVERVDTYKYLSVIFDSKLNWKENINSVLKKVNLGVIFDSKLNWKENINSVLKKSELENALHEKAEIIWSKFRYASNFL